MERQHVGIEEHENFKYRQTLLEFRSLKALKQVTKALPTALHVAVGKERVAKNSSAKKPLPPAKRKAVGKAFATRHTGSRQRERTPL